MSEMEWKGKNYFKISTKVFYGSVSDFGIYVPESVDA